MDAFICDAQRTPIGRYGGALSQVRTDDLAAIPIAALMERNPQVNWAAIDDVIYGDANQAGEDNRNVARMAALLAGLPVGVPGTTVNRLCASGMDAVGMAARAIRAGDYDMAIAGGVESMSRAPFVVGKSENAFGRDFKVFDSTIGDRFPNPRIHKEFGADTMPETADNLASDFQITREEADTFALASQMKYKAGKEAGFFDDEIDPVTYNGGRKVGDVTVSDDEHPRPQTTMESLAKLRVLFEDGVTTAGNASGVNDGAVAVLIGSKELGERTGMKPIAKILSTAAAGVPPRIMGFGPVPATEKALARAGLTHKDLDVIEINEAFASQVLACLKGMGLPYDDSRVNMNGGAIALGHPLGASGPRIALTAARQLQRTGGKYALATLCVGLGQGAAMIMERCD